MSRARRPGPAGTANVERMSRPTPASSRRRREPVFRTLEIIARTLVRAQALDLRFTPLAACDPAHWPLEPPRLFLQLYGAGHVGRAIVRLLADLPCRVWWIDERESEFPAGPLPPHIERVCVEPVEAEVCAAPPGCHYLVLTHSHDLDMAIAQAVLARDDVAWFGLIGSATKRARFEHRLAARGVPADRLARMACPIGLPGIAGKAPEVIAIAVVAQLLQLGGAERPAAT